MFGMSAIGCWAKAEISMLGRRQQQFSDDLISGGAALTITRVRLRFSAAPLVFALLCAACSYGAEARSWIGYTLTDNGIARSASGMRSNAVWPALIPLSSKAAANMTSVGKTRPMPAATPLNDKALRRLFSTDYNTYLIPHSGEVIVSHPQYELFRPNGTYWRSTGRTGIEGIYTIGGDLLCVMGGSIPKQCRKVISQSAKIYLLIDVFDNSQTLVTISRGK